MWLLLVAAGTGYLARCWQKSRKFKMGPCILKCNARLYPSQESPSDTPRRRDRPTISGRRGLHRRSTRGIGRKLFHGMKEGKLVTTYARGLDDDLGFSDKVSDDLLCTNNFSGHCASDHGTHGQEQTSSLLFCIHGKNYHESSRESYSCMEKPLLPNANIVANENSTENASLVIVPIRQLVHAIPACSEVLSSKVNGGERRHSIPLKLKKLTEKAFHFVTKVARGFGHRTGSTLLSRTKGSSNLKPNFSLSKCDVHVFKYLSDGKTADKTLSEEKKKERTFGGCHVHLQNLKRLLDPEYLGHCKRWDYLPFSSSSYVMGKKIACSADFSGLGMVTNGRCPLVDNVSGDWIHTFETTSQFAKPPNSFAASKLEPLCSRENVFHKFNELSYVALGLAMGVLLVATSRSNELENLHMLLRKNITLVQELRKEIDSKFEPDPSKLLEVEKIPSVTTHAQKVHLHSEIISLPSRGEIDSAKVFKASNNHEASESRGFDDLEAELEAELQLIDLNGCSTEQAEYESNWIKHSQNNWLSEGDENGEDETSYVDITIHDPLAIQDASQVYDSDFIVPPLELERRLWQVLEQRHKERICELENDLRVSQETITAKEMEVQWWKDRVWWLMETSPGEKSEGLHQ